MKKAMLFGFGFAAGVKLVKLLEMGLDYGLLKLMSNSEEFTTFIEVNNPDLAKKLRMLRHK